IAPCSATPPDDLLRETDALLPPDVLLVTPAAMPVASNTRCFTVRSTSWRRPALTVALTPAPADSVWESRW
ncbi:MAG: hypothetical protein IPO15_11285, partial [Anaerolineae bacterium]|uniref:hypothetical protein n=1 Tax=Candidatus Amarolinea dominans TaxID=3140696 RepID=UPI003136C4CA|nr:hypothetical protein [Anaerolineae bacterium]